MAHAQQGGEAPERSYVSSMFDDDSRYSGNLFVDTDLVTPMKSLWPVPGSRLKQFDSVLRVLPGKRDDGRWSAFRTGTGKGEYGRWIYSAWAARAIGEPAVTFFLCSDKDVKDLGYDPRQHPVYVLYNSIYWAVDGGNPHVKAHWAPMITSKQRKVIKKPGPMFLVQCLIYGRGDKMYDPPMGVEDGEKIVCFDLASDGGKSLRALLDHRKTQNDEEQPEEGAAFADYYRYGDITAFDGGKFVQIFPAGQNPNREASAAPAAGPRRSLSRAAVVEGRSRAQKAIDDEKEKIGYEVEILDEYQGWSPGIEPDLAEVLAEKIHPWPDIIKVPDHKTAASYLWSRMRFNGELKLDVLLYAWQDHPDWLPDQDSDVWAEWVARKQVATAYDPNAGERDDDDEQPAAPAHEQGVDRRPRQRAGDASERADDQPRPARRLGTAAQAPPEAQDDDEPAPQRPSRMVAQQAADTEQEAASAQEEAPAQEPQPLKGRVGRTRAPKPATTPAPAAAPAEEIAGKRAAPDAAAVATNFRPSAAAAAAAGNGDDHVVNKASGFTTPPAAPAPKATTPKATAPAAPAPAAVAAPAGKGVKDILAQARAKFAGGNK